MVKLDVWMLLVLLQLSSFNHNINIIIKVHAFGNFVLPKKIFGMNVDTENLNALFRNDDNIVSTNTIDTNYIEQQV
jgi:hypothetical protein